MSSTAHTLAEITLVLGAPLHDRTAFDEFQTLATLGDVVAEHAWATREHEAIRGLTAREGTIANHTLLETMVGGALGVPVLIADTEPRWVRHEDGLLYAAITFAADDVRPRAAAVALHQPAAIEALDTVAAALAPLDGREWLRWSSRSEVDHGGDAQLQRIAALMADIAEGVLREADPRAAASDTPASGDTTDIDLVRDLLHAIRAGQGHARDGSPPLVRELRALRHRDPLRYEWQLVSMDAFLLASQTPDALRQQLEREQAAALAYLYVGKERTDRLKQDPVISARFHRELLARAYMTAYALQRLAAQPSELLLRTMATARG